MIHPQLQRDCFVLGQLSLSHLLLMNDSRYPWFILVPAVEGIQEIYQLTPTDQQQLLAESNWLAENLQKSFAADKINIAALGNVVPQLHVHHIVRYRTDDAWPAPVWGKYPAKAYNDNSRQNLLQSMTWLWEYAPFTKKMIPIEP